MFRENIVLSILLLIAIKWSGANECAYSEFKAYQPAGVRITIPYIPGMREVKLTVELKSGEKEQVYNEDEYGTLSQILSQVPVKGPINGCLIYEDQKTKFRKYDPVTYIYHYLIGDEVHVGFNNTLVTELHSYSPKVEAKQKNCLLSFTRIYDGKKDKDHRHPCSGELIFHDNFQEENIFESNKWTIVERFPYTSDFEFAFYRNSFDNIIFYKNTLKILPTLLSVEYGDEFLSYGNLNLIKCTSSDIYECQRSGSRGWSILHPVSSGRLNTKKFFNFIYGKVEIRARLPHGDWLYPLLMLESRDGETGSYQIRIASSAGNEVFGRELWGGLINATSTEDRLGNAKKAIKYSSELWSKNFHTYEMTWIPGKTNSTMLFSVDGEMYGQKEVEPLPKDIPFYLTIGLGVGGVMEFPESTHHVIHKPWKNTDPKAMYNFYKDINNWSKTWSPDPSLEVEYVKVWAL